MNEDALEREVRERGQVVWMDSARGGAGYYRWTLFRDDAQPVTGLADSEDEGWARIREYVAAPHRSFRHVRRHPRGGV